MLSRGEHGEPTASTPRSFRVRFGLVAGLTIIGMVITLAVLLASPASDLLLGQARADLRRRNQAIVGQLDGLVDKASSALVLTRQHPAFNRYFLATDDLTRQEARQEIEAYLPFLAQTFAIDEICVITATGTETIRAVQGVMAGAGELSIDEHDNPFFAPTMALADGAVYRSALPYRSPDTNRWVVAFATPIVLPDGRRAGLLHFEIPLAWFAAKVSALDDAESYSFLSTREGQVLVHPSPLAVAAGDHGHAAGSHGQEPGEPLPFPAATVLGGEGWAAVLTMMRSGQDGMATVHQIDRQDEVVYQLTLDRQWVVATVMAQPAILVPARLWVGQVAILAGALLGVPLLLTMWYAGRLQARAQRDASETRFRGLVQHASDLIMIVDAEGVISYLTPSVGRLLGHAPEHVIGGRLHGLAHLDDLPLLLAAVTGALSQSGPSTPLQWRARCRDGSWLDVETTITNLLADPNVRGLVLNSHDISEHQRLEAQLTHQALHDSLTDLANRALFQDRVRHALLRAERFRRPVAVLFIDLDNFKAINDSYGHDEGDRLLVALAERVLSVLRTGDTVARLGGDEFAVLLEEAVDPRETATVAERLSAACAEPLHLHGRSIQISASIGIAVSAPGVTADEVLRNADVAMYAAKAAGKGQYTLFESGMHTAVLARLELEADLRQALDAGQFLLHYQPAINLQTGQVTGVEALVRWHHPRQGLVPPNRFIPIAEETGLILPLGRWVLAEACRQLGRWHRQFPQDPPLTVAVNLSARQMREPALVDDVATVLRETAIPPASLMLEITESVMMHDTVATIETLHRLKALGIALAIDDFGTGYSSLKYLQRFPIDVLKIDKAFIDGIGADPNDAGVARTIIQLGQTLRLKTVAEGIEEAGQLAHLRHLGCHLGQGFYFAKPLAGDALEAFLWRTMGSIGSRPGPTDPASSQRWSA